MRLARGSRFLFLCAAWGFQPSVAAAVVWQVTRPDDLPDYQCPSLDRCTLRGAVAVARDEDEIHLTDASGTPVVITLTDTLVVDKAIEIFGTTSGSDRVAVRPAGAFRPLVAAGRTDATTTIRIRLTGFTLRDGVVRAPNGANGSTPGANGSSGATAHGGCLLADGRLAAVRVTLTRMALQDCEAIGGDGGQGASGFDSDRGPGGAGGAGGDGGQGRGGALAVLGDASIDMTQTSIAASTAIGGRGGNGGRGGSGTIAGGTGGSGGFGGEARGGAMFLQSTRDAFVLNSSFLLNGLEGGDGGIGGSGGRASGAGTPGPAGPHRAAGTMAGGNIGKGGSAFFFLSHATLGPVLLERGVPGGWDGISGTGLSSIVGEALFATGPWGAFASAVVGASPYSLCEGDPPQLGNDGNAATSQQCFGEATAFADATGFDGDMAVTFDQGRAVATPRRNSRLVDALADSWVSSDQSGRPRPVDGNGDGVASDDIGAVEIEYSPVIFTDGFED
jgi:hypothetical protein